MHLHFEVTFIEHILQGERNEVFLGPAKNMGKIGCAFWADGLAAFFDVAQMGNGDAQFFSVSDL